MPKSFLFLIALLFALSACEKEPGFGGNARITGNVFVQDYNPTYTIKIGEYPGADREVYIMAEGQLTPLDRIRANYQGNFDFNYLYKGKYTIYVYSDDTTFTNTSGMMTVLKEVEIKQNREEVKLDTLMVYDL